MTRMEDFPESVRKELSALGVPDDHEPAATLAAVCHGDSSEWSHSRSCGCMFLAVCIVLALAVGLYHLGGLVTSWFS